MDQNVLVQALEIVNLLEAGDEKDAELVVILGPNRSLEVLLEDRVRATYCREFLERKCSTSPSRLFSVAGLTANATKATRHCRP